MPVQFLDAIKYYSKLFLGAFAKFQKATIRFVMFVRLYRTIRHPIEDFHATWYLRIFRNSVEITTVLLKYDTNNEYFTKTNTHF
jgi:hypothetical protein